MLSKGSLLSRWKGADEMVILITGITGHSGRYFAQHLNQHGFSEQLRLVVREQSDTSFIKGSQLTYELAIGNLEDDEFIASSMKGIHTILHIYNIYHSEEIVRHAIRQNVNRVILVHTTGIFSRFKEASQDYQRIEDAIHKLVQDSDRDIQVTILRPTMIYGDLTDHNMSKFIKLIDRLPVIPIIGKGTATIQPIHAEDLGHFYMQVLLHPENVKEYDYIVSGEHPLTMKQVFTEIANALSKKKRFIYVPLSLAMIGAYLLKILSIGKFDMTEQVQRMTEDRSFPHAEATRDFGYTPRSFKDGIKREVDQYLQIR